MEGYIDNINFFELPAMKYYACPTAWEEEKKRELMKQKILEDEWLGARKRDGSFWKFVKDEDGNMKLLGRNKGVNGEYPNKIEWVPHLKSFFELLPNGTCFLGELYLPQHESAKETTTILGCLKDKAITRQEKGEKLKYYIFDILAFNNKSWVNVSARDRFEFLKKFENKQYIEFARYCTGQELLKELSEIFNEGGEGIVVINPSSAYQPDKRSNKVSLKIKKEITETIDCFFTGRYTNPIRLYSGKEIELWKYWENVKTGVKLPEGLHYHEYYDGKPIEPVTKSYYFDMVGSLEIGVLKEEEIVPIGTLSGLSEEIKSNPLSVKGKCIEVSCMEIFDDTKGLRHPKLIRFRDDLSIKDCTWDKIFK